MPSILSSTSPSSRSCFTSVTIVCCEAAHQPSAAGRRGREAPSPRKQKTGWVFAPHGYSARQQVCLRDERAGGEGGASECAIVARRCAAPRALRAGSGAQEAAASPRSASEAQLCACCCACRAPHRALLIADEQCARSLHQRRHGSRGLRPRAVRVLGTDVEDLALSVVTLA